MIALTAAYISSCGLAYYLRGRGAFEGAFGAKTLNGFIWALPVLFIAPEWWALLAYAVAALGTKYAMQMGHGSYFDLARSDTPDDETIKPLLFWLKPGYWYDAIGLALTGVFGLVPLTVVVVAVTGDYLFGFVCLSGMIKPLAYELGWRVKEAGFRENPIGLGEILFGVMGGSLVALFLHGGLHV